MSGSLTVALAAFGAVLLMAAQLTLGAILRGDAIEYASNSEQIAFWHARCPATGTPVLLTFASDVTIAEAMPQLARAFLGPNSAAEQDGQCALMANDNTPLRLASGFTASDSTLLAELIDVATGDDGAQLFGAERLQLACYTQHMHSHATKGAAGGGAGWLRMPLVAYSPPTPPPASRPKWIGSSQWPNTNADLVADTVTGLLHWAVEFVAVHWGEVHPFQSWTTTGQSGRFNLNTGAPISVDTPGALAFADGASRDTSDSELRVSLTADWGSGTEESSYVANLMVKDYAPHWTVHVGDVYYLGAKEDFQSNVFGVPPTGVANAVTWPHGSIGSLGLEGNHEMYSRGIAYFDDFLPTLGVRNASGALGGQGASYFSLENDYWRVIGLDTGYNTYSVLFENNDNPQPQAVIDWLTNDVKIGDPTDTRGIIFLTHHQPLTAFDPTDKYLATPKQLNALLPANRTVLYLFGHEHRLSFYDVNSGLDGLSNLHLYARCIGNGGFPSSIAPIPNRAASTHLAVYDDRVYELYDGFWKTQIGFQGFQHLNFTGPRLTIDYRSLALEADGKTPNPNVSDLLVTEAWTTSAAGDVVLDSFAIVNPNMTVVNPNLAP